MGSDHKNGLRRVKLSKQGALDLVDRESQRRLNMSGSEFVKLLKEGKLPDSAAKRDLEVLVQWIGENKVQQGHSTVRGAP